MARPNSHDPLTQLNARFPLSLVERIRREARDRGDTVSTVLRSYLAFDLAQAPDIKRRMPSPPTTRRADPELLRQLCAIGNNLNQIARAANRNAHVGASMDTVEVLAALRCVELHVLQTDPFSKARDAH